jgi:hypothetical protein
VAHIGGGFARANPPPERCRAPVHDEHGGKMSRTSGDIADPLNQSTLLPLLQGLQPRTPVRVEIDGPEHGQLVTLLIQCSGLFAAGGERE